MHKVLSTAREIDHNTISISISITALSLGFTFHACLLVWVHIVSLANAYASYIQPHATDRYHKRWWAINISPPGVWQQLSQNFATRFSGPSLSNWWLACNHIISYHIKPCHHHSHTIHNRIKLFFSFFIRSRCLSTLFNLTCSNEKFFPLFLPN